MLNSYRDFKVTRTSLSSWTQNRQYNLELSDGVGSSLLTLQLQSESECSKWFDEFRRIAELYGRRSVVYQ